MQPSTGSKIAVQSQPAALSQAFLHQMIGLSSLSETLAQLTAMKRASVEEYGWADEQDGEEPVFDGGVRSAIDATVLKVLDDVEVLAGKLRRTATRKPPASPIDCNVVKLRDGDDSVFVAWVGGNLTSRTVVGHGPTPAVAVRMLSATLAGRRDPDILTDVVSIDAAPEQEKE